MSTLTTLPFVGGEMGSFDPQDNGAKEDTTAVTYRSAFARCGIKVAQFSNGFKSPTWSAAANFWCRCVLYPAGGLANVDIVYFLNGSTVIAKVQQCHGGVGSPTTALYTLQSGVLTLVGTFNMPVGTLALLDFQIVGNTASGSAAVYVAGTQIFNVSGLNHSGFTGVTQMQAFAANTWSEIICDTVPHVGGALYTLNLDTNGASQNWTGGVGNIDEVVYSDASFIFSATNAAISVFTASTATLSGFFIRGVGVGARMLTGASSAVTRAKVVVRSGATNFPLGSSVVLNAGYQAVAGFSATDPHTTVTWTATNAALAAGGVQA